MEGHPIYGGVSHDTLCDLLDREIAKRQFAEIVAAFYAFMSIILLSCLIFL